MISSMTGFGAASAQVNGVSYQTEVRSLNNRYFKSTLRLPEQFQRFEADIDRQLRTGLGRGSIVYALRVRDENAAAGYEINGPALAHYVRRLSAIAAQQPGTMIDLSGLLEVPGVCEPAEIDEEVLKAQFEVVGRLTNEAISRVIEMRRNEGAALLKDLLEQCALIRGRLDRIRERCPGVVEEYRRRFHARVQQLMAGASLDLDQDSIIREVAIFAERCDVNEEVSRLASHLDQFEELCRAPEEAGRKLEFLAQEMLRETNTIGSKASDAAIARHVVEIKAAIDRIKEQVQNVE